VLDGDELYVALFRSHVLTQFVKSFGIRSHEREEVIDGFLSSVTLGKRTKFGRRGDPALLDVVRDYGNRHSCTTLPARSAHVFYECYTRTPVCGRSPAGTTGRKAAKPHDMGCAARTTASAAVR
jgi:hypothetical protein